MSSTFAVMRSEPLYRRLITASLVSGVGDWFNSIAVFTLLLRLTGGSGMSVAILLSLRVVPYLFMGPIAGVLADKWNRKWILILSDLARMVIALTFLFVHSPNQLWISYAGTFGLVFFTVLFNPARMAVVPQLVSEEQLVAANAIQESTSGIVMAIGSLLAGLVTGIFGLQTAFVFNSITFLLSALLCMSIHFPQGGPSSRLEKERSPDGNIRLWTVVRRNRIVQVMLILDTIWPIGGGIINVLLSVYAFKVFHMGNLGVGLMYGALGVGFMFGGIVTHRFARFGRFAVLVGLVIEGLCQMGVSQSPNIWIASSLLVIATVGSGVSNAYLNSLIMKGVDTQLHGRVYALSGTASSIMLSLSMLAAGVLLSEVTPRTLGLYGGALMVLAAVITGLAVKRDEPLTSTTKSCPHQ